MRGIINALPAAALLWMLFFAAIGVIGCSSAPKPTIEIQRVEVPVMKPCVPKVVKDGKPARYPDEGVEADPDPASRYQRIAAANELRKGRLAVVEPVISTCP